MKRSNPQERPAALANSGDRALIPIGPLVNLHGLQGELRLLLYNPASETLQCGSSVTLRRAGLQRSARVRSLRRHKQFLLITLEGHTTAALAEQLVGSEVCVSESDLPPVRPGEVYHYQLKGLSVVTTTGIEIGTVAEVMVTAGHDVCVVRQKQREHLIPLIADVVKQIDLEQRKLIIDPIPGLLDDAL